MQRRGNMHRTYVVVLDWELGFDDNFKGWIKTEQRLPYTRGRGNWRYPKPWVLKTSK